MTIKLVGAGFGRTGTLSLKFALEKLGFELLTGEIRVKEITVDAPELNLSTREDGQGNWVFGSEPGASKVPWQVTHN